MLEDLVRNLRRPKLEFQFSLVIPDPKLGKVSLSNDLELRGLDTCVMDPKQLSIQIKTTNIWCEAAAVIDGAGSSASFFIKPHNVTALHRELPGGGSSAIWEACILVVLSRAVTRPFHFHSMETLSSDPPWIEGQGVTSYE